jgi:hypothetical protein
VSGPVTSVARVEDVQIFLKDPVFIIQIFLDLATEMLYIHNVGKPGDNRYKRNGST